MKNSFSICFLTLVLITLTSQVAVSQILPRSDAGYKVVINHEEQYAVYPVKQATPKNWKETQITGSLKECHNYIEEVWTDMRPLSVRKMNLPAGTTYQVVVNDENQYMVWPAKTRVPEGWKSSRKTGDLRQCQTYIEEVWTDMRPLSFRR